jgi:hypothetical protein
MLHDMIESLKMFPYEASNTIIVVSTVKYVLVYKGASNKGLIATLILIMPLIWLNANQQLATFLS